MDNTVDKIPLDILKKFGRLRFVVNRKARPIYTKQVREELEENGIKCTFTNTANGFIIELDNGKNKKQQEAQNNSTIQETGE